MADDFYDDVARKRAATLQAARQRCIANLEEFRATGDDYSAQEELGTLSVLDRQMEDLNRLHAQYHAQRNPAPTEIGDQEFRAMSPERMAQNPELVERVFQNSKYYSPDQWSDPEVKRRFLAGVQEVQRRKRHENGGR